MSLKVSAYRGNTHVRRFQGPGFGGILFFGLILAAAFPAPANAQPNPMKMMGNMDDDEDGRISKDEWLALFREFPDRFVMGSENFVGESSARSGPPGGLTNDNTSVSRDFLEALPKDLAERIAYRNALRIYGISMQ